MTSDENKISINGVNWDETKESKTLDDGSYVHFTGTGEGNDIGYYLLKVEMLTLLKIQELVDMMI